jgi:hypothetical protein
VAIVGEWVNMLETTNGDVDAALQRCNQRTEITVAW